jgi:hypothetical protein
VRIIECSLAKRANFGCHYVFAGISVVIEEIGSQRVAVMFAMEELVSWAVDGDLFKVQSVGGYNVGVAGGHVEAYVVGFELAQLLQVRSECVVRLAICDAAADYPLIVIFGSSAYLNATNVDWVWRGESVGRVCLLCECKRIMCALRSNT